MDSQQFGALKGSSTVHALLTMIDHWCAKTDDSRDGNIARILLKDYAKAFDRINPRILFKKLRELDIPDFLVNLISVCFKSTQAVCKD